LAKKLGAEHYIDASAGQVVQEMQKLGGAKVVLATAPSAKAMSEMVGALAKNGRLMILGAAQEPIPVNAIQLLLARKSIQGWPSGTARDSEDTLKFSSLTGVRPMIEKYPLAKAAEAYDRMITGKARFRVVLKMSS
jgi:D-arabinose 1-dehydrogenase-like Zn-dependent alcohol dehydrogenase